MGYAFQISQDDVDAVLRSAQRDRLKLNPGESIEDAAGRVFDMLDDDAHARIEKAALYADDLDAQTEAAYDVLREILDEYGVIHDAGEPCQAPKKASKGMQP